jgi:lysozyme family protein
MVRTEQQNTSDGQYPSRFTRYFDKTIEFEVGNYPNGGWSNKTKEWEGCVQWGLAAKYHADLAFKINGGMLSRDEAKAVYYKEYYLPIYGISQVDPGIGFLLFDTRVHGNFRTLIKYIQRYLNACGAKLAVDGLYGPKTSKMLILLDKNSAQDFLAWFKRCAEEMGREAAARVAAIQVSEHTKVFDFTKSFTKRYAARAQFSVELG